MSPTLDTDLDNNFLRRQVDLLSTWLNQRQSLTGLQRVWLVDLSDAVIRALERDERNSDEVKP